MLSAMSHVQTRALQVVLARPSYVRLFSTPAKPASNHELVQLLTRYKEEEEAMETRNPYKVRAFERAIKAISDLQEPVRSAAQVRRLSGIGERIAKRIDAFLSNVPYEGKARTKENRARRAAFDMEGHRKPQIVDSLQMIPGIGKQKAEQLYHAGCTSIAELSKPQFLNMLRPSQQTCAQFAGKLELSVTLEQAESVKEFIAQNISSKYEVLLVGDHRRHCSTSPHLTMMIVYPFELAMKPPEKPYDPNRKLRAPSFAHFSTLNSSLLSFPQFAESTPLFFDVTSPLVGRGLVAETVAAGPHRWRGIIRLPQRSEGGHWEDRAERLKQIKDREGRYSQLEIFCIPQQRQGAALMALTGDSEFIKDICSRAQRLGLHFNEYGLWRWCESGNWEFMHGDSEEGIFSELGMDYIEPYRRNFAFLNTRVKRGRPRLAPVEGAFIEKPKAPRGRPRKTPAEAASQPKVPGKRGRPKKVLTQE
ncbi:hypothetical protein ID866_6612 [Astraeus odoratus]|nr:hypothetical protein ID866_6612 [Astraeus odoratus]